jgi:hypothetical protein
MFSLKSRLAIIIIVAAGSSACRTTAPHAAPPKSAALAAPVAAPVEPEPSADDVRRFADAFVADWMTGARPAMYLKLCSRFRDSVPLERLDAVVDAMNRTFGQPLETDYKRFEVGTSTSSDGTRKLWRVWYALRTSTKEKGTYFATVDIVTDPPLGVQAFNVAVFPNGAPPFLR